MAGKFIIKDEKTTMAFTQTAVTAKILAIVDAAAHHFYMGGLALEFSQGTEDIPSQPVPYENLTDQQKLDIVDAYIKRIIKDAARAYKVEIATQAAVDAADLDAKDNLNL